jgi:sporadic carbohydrate cluster protein (TIGR04323 family)
MTERRGLRGYIGSRPYFGSRAPQHVQNLVIRDYCLRIEKPFLLSATEYAMPNCFMMLERVMQEITEIEGIVLYSLFMLPKNRERRERIWDNVLTEGAVLHAAIEGYAIITEEDTRRAEDIWRIHEAMPHCIKSL